MRALVVDDDTVKRQAIVKTLVGAGVSKEEIAIAPDGGTARRLLQERRYDLLVLDIALPDDIDADLSPEGGLVLLRDVFQRDYFHVPPHIVGLTAYEDIIKASKAEFDKSGLSFLHYSASSSSWSEGLTQTVRRITRAGSMDNIEEHRSDVAVVCALRDPELSALLRNGWRWEETKFTNDDTYYHRARVTSGQRQVVVHAAAASRMGTEAAALLATRMIVHFRPKYLAMCGIAAAMPGKAAIGDVVVADPAWNWGTGKWVERNGTQEFEPAPHQIPLSGSLRERLVRFATDRQLLAKVKAGWQGNAPTHELSVLVGPMASGASVLADGHMSSLIHDQHRKALAVEMETYGVYAAGGEATLCRPEAFSMKSVVDFANPMKGDEWQKYGAYTSAAALTQFIIDYL